MKIRKKQKQPKTCREYKKMIVGFLESDMEVQEKRDLFRHLEKCPDCNEELKIQYLIREGLSRLEQGKNFDLNKDFKVKLKKERQNVAEIYRISCIYRFLEIAGLLFTAAVLVISLI